MKQRPRKSSRRKRTPPAPLGRDAWLQAARAALIEEGTAGVEINKLARRLRVSRGGFYWFFASRAELLDQLLAQWADTSTVLFERVCKADGRSGIQKYQALTDLWIAEQEYDPRWDGAIRDWARTSTAVLKVVHAVDDQRIAFIERIFLELGYKDSEAHVRARVTYYHQVGYYALGIRESRRQRLELLPFYTQILTGCSV